MSNAATRPWLIALALVVAGANCGAGCKKSSAEPGAAKKADLPELPELPPSQRTPVVGADLAALNDADKARFESFADKLPSPCGKAQSLRASRNTDKDCAIPAKFGVDFVIALLADGATDDDVKELYAARYKDQKHYDLKIGPAVPHIGPEDARVVMVEFFDYGCPACGQMYPVVEEMIKTYPHDLVVYYKEFPLAAHPDSPGAAAAAIAAGKQGKYLEMHALLFKDQYAHKQENLDQYATQLGLDMTKFKADSLAATAQIEADKAEGNGVGVEGTPTIFLNGKRWDGPPAAKYMKMWIEEQLALNR